MATPDSLAGLVASYLDLKWNIDPVAATLAGLTEHDHRLGRYSEEDTRQHVAALKSMGAALEDVSVSTLDDEIDRTALLNELRVAVQRLTKERPTAPTRLSTLRIFWTDSTPCWPLGIDRVIIARGPRPDGSGKSQHSWRPPKTPSVNAPRCSSKLRSKWWRAAHGSSPKLPRT